MQVETGRPDMYDVLAVYLRGVTVYQGIGCLAHTPGCHGDPGDAYRLAAPKGRMVAATTKSMMKDEVPGTTLLHIIKRVFLIVHIPTATR